MGEVVMVDDRYKQVRYECINYDEHCASLAASGACEPPEGYDEWDGIEEDEEYNLYLFMLAECAPACQSCDLLIKTEEDIIIEKCAADYDTDIFGEGDLDSMFMRIVGEEPFDEDVVVPDFTANIHSRPLPVEGMDVSMVDYHVGPWIVTLDNFLTDEECDYLVELGAKQGYERSSLEEEKDYDEEEMRVEKETDDAYRTSTNSWCWEECFEDPVTQRVLQKISNTTGVPDSYSEYMQMLKYVPGQYYKEHHDYIDDSRDISSGPRILTFFLYLNDVEEGGATRFTDIHGDNSGVFIDVKPKKGTALVWPSVLSEDPSERDDRTYHEALTLVKGLKYGANAWLHLRNVKDDDCDYEEYLRVTGRDTPDDAEEEDYYEEGEEEEEEYDEENDDVPLEEE